MRCLTLSNPGFTILEALAIFFSCLHGLRIHQVLREKVLIRCQNARSDDLTGLRMPSLIKSQRPNEKMCPQAARPPAMTASA